MNHVRSLLMRNAHYRTLAERALIAMGIRMLGLAICCGVAHHYLGWCGVAGCIGAWLVTP